MFRRQAEVRVPEQLSGHGTLETERGSFPVPRFTMAREKYDPAAAWEAELSISPGDHDACEKALRWSRGAPSFRGLTGTGYGVHVPELYWNRWSSGVLRARPSEIELLEPAVSAAPIRQALRVELSPTNLALPELEWLIHSHTGEIAREDGLSQQNDPLVWDSQLGRATLVTHFRYERVAVGGIESTLQVPVPVLHIRSVIADHISTNPTAVARSLITEANLVLRLLSFLNRRYVDWRSVEVTSEVRTPKGRTDIRRDFLINGDIVLEEHRPDSTLIDPHLAGADALDQMISALRTSPYREALMSGMLHVVAAYQSRFVEPAFVNAITAVETVVNGITTTDRADQIIDTRRFRTLSQHIMAALEEFVADNPDLAELERSLICNRIAELNRRPIIPRIVDLISRFAIEWKDLWSPGTDLHTGLRSLFRRRGRFLHAGALGSLTHAHDDARRAQAIAERLIYASLGGEAEWQDERVYAPFYYLSTVQLERDQEQTEP